MTVNGGQFPGKEGIFMISFQFFLQAFTADSFNIFINTFYASVIDLAVSSLVVTLCAVATGVVFSTPPGDVIITRPEPSRPTIVPPSGFGMLESPAMVLPLDTPPM